MAQAGPATAPQRAPGHGTGDSVDGKAMAALEAPHRAACAGTTDPVDRATVETDLVAIGHATHLHR